MGVDDGCTGVDTPRRMSAKDGAEFVGVEVEGMVALAFARICARFTGVFAGGNVGVVACCGDWMTGGAAGGIIIGGADCAGANAG